MPADNPTAPVEYAHPFGDPAYWVGTDGSLWSLWVRRGRKWHIGTEWQRLKAAPQRYGHLKIKLRGHPRVYVHTLVLEAFVGPRPPGMECRHLDGDPSNNRLDNLRWGTHQENMDDRGQHGIWKPCKGEANGNAKATEDVIRSIRADYDQGGCTYADLAAKYGLGYWTVAEAVLGDTWKHIDDRPPRPRGKRGALPGEKHPMAALNEEAVREIRQLRFAGESQYKIAAKFGVTRSAIQAIVERRTWAHVV